ncbi:MAG: carboxymuconolactone decarboxylase family protein [Chloroflexota bacterium]|nr:carboxymuconolactone decarboxylase family protein [Chloroflexota bacterium]
MERITPVGGKHAPLLLKALNWVSRRWFGQEATPTKILAHNPGFLLPSLFMSRFVQGKTALPPAIRPLAMHLVAEINGCAWCRDFGQAMGMKQGIPAEKFAAVADYTTSLLFTPAERAALAYAAAVTQTGAHVSDATFATLKEHFSEREIVELTVAIAAENFYNRFNAPLGIESQGFCAIPSRPMATSRHAA